LLGDVNIFLFLRVCWQRPAMFFFHTSSKLSCPKFDFLLKFKVIGSNTDYFLNYFLLYSPFKAWLLGICNYNYSSPIHKVSRNSLCLIFKSHESPDFRFCDVISTYYRNYVWFFPPQIYLRFKQVWKYSAAASFMIQKQGTVLPQIVSSLQ